MGNISTTRALFGPLVFWISGAPFLVRLRLAVCQPSGPIYRGGASRIAFLLLGFPAGRLIGEDLKASRSPRQFHFRDGDSALRLQRLRGVLDRAKRLHVGRELAVAVDVPIELAFVEYELLMGLQPAQLMNGERNRRGPTEDLFGSNPCHYANTSPASNSRRQSPPSSSFAGGYDVKQL